MNDMKINLPPILDWGVRLIGLFLILFLSVEIDKFAFGMKIQRNMKTAKEKKKTHCLK
jgi:hypothetical protein